MTVEEKKEEINSLNGLVLFAALVAHSVANRIRWPNWLTEVPFPPSSPSPPSIQHGPSHFPFFLAGIIRSDCKQHSHNLVSSPPARSEFNHHSCLVFFSGPFQWNHTSSTNRRTLPYWSGSGSSSSAPWGAIRTRRFCGRRRTGTFRSEGRRFWKRTAAWSSKTWPRTIRASTYARRTTRSVRSTPRLSWWLTVSTEID